MEPFLLPELRAQFEAYRNEPQAAKMSKYMKDKFPFFGIMNGPRKELCRPFQDAMKAEPWVQIRQMAEACWAQPEREFHYFALEMLLAAKKKWEPSALGLFEEMIVKQSWWDSVDAIASNLVGGYFLKWPEEKTSTLERWNASGNLWLIRTTFIFQLKYDEATDFDLMQRLFAPHLGSREFFIQKAMGWALRQYARYDAAAVIEYVNRTPLSNLTKREAMKHLGN